MIAHCPADWKFDMRILILIACILFSTSSQAFDIKLSGGQKADLPDGTYIAYFNKGCGSLAVENGKVSRFVIADGCNDEDFAKPTMVVDKISIKGNSLKIGTAKYRIESIDSGVVRGEWSYNGWIGPISFLLKR
jgi:hypothetical protein